MPASDGNNLILGNVSGSKERLQLSAENRSTHLYVCGSTGTGKSKFLENLIRQDIKNWRRHKCGMLMIDAHGSLYDSVVRWMAFHNLERPLVLIDLSNPDWVVGYNALRQRKVYDPAVLSQNFIQAMAYVWGETGTSKTPLFARWADNVLRALYASDYTLLEAEFLIDKSHPDIQQKILRKLKDRGVKCDWEFIQSLNAKDYNAEVSSTMNRLRRFLATQKLRQMFGQEYSTLDMERALEDGAIILVNLSTEGNIVGGEDASLLATLLLSDLWMAARARGKKASAKPFYVYLDEFQNFVTPTMAANLDEARGYGLHLTLAHQFPNQLLHTGAAGPSVFDSIMENARSKVVFEVGTTNLEQLAQALFLGTFNPDEIKHKMYSTKVMDYREEMRRSYSKSSTEAHGYGENERFAENFADNDSTDPISVSYSSGTTDFNSDSETEGFTDSPMLIPQMGKELSHIQYRDLEEQLFRAMAVLFDQEQRECVVKLQGMSAPASIRTPTVRDAPTSDKRVKDYVVKTLEESGVAIRASTAKYRLRCREEDIFRENSFLDEFQPTTAKRKLH
jgi:hypothetical protein